MVAHWKRDKDRRAPFYMAINGVGAAATGCTVVVVLVAKFVEGAWITVLMIPILILLMRGVHKHYTRVAQETEIGKLTLDPTPAPLAILVVAHWDRPSQEALRFATSLTHDIHVVYVQSEGEKTSERW